MPSPANLQFYNCVCGQGSGCTSGVINPFTLFDIATTITPIQTYFNAAGFSCVKTAKNCFIEVEIKFVAQCLPAMPSPDPTPPATCPGIPAEFIGITYQVRQNPLSLDQGAFFKPIGSTVYTEVTKINPPGSGVCP